MKLASILLCCIALSGMLPVTQAAAPASWQLQDGGTVTVDPDTQRATVTRDGVTTPLYDGTHRTADDDILIIRRGIATIPRKTAAEQPEQKIPPAEQWEGAPIVGYSPCEKLVRRSCGVRNQCADQDGCGLARQLLDMEKIEREESGTPGRMTYTSGQCIEAEPDTEMFRVCEKR